MIIPKLNRTDKSANEVMEYRWDIKDRLTAISQEFFSNCKSC